MAVLDFFDLSLLSLCLLLLFFVTDFDLDFFVSEFDLDFYVAVLDADFLDDEFDWDFLELNERPLPFDLHSNKAKLSYC